MSLLRAHYSRIPPKVYRLRWRFTYSDGKPDKRGTWDETSPHDCDKASFQPKENLARAIIEGECRRTKRIVQFVDIPGHELKHVRCEAWSPMSVGLATDNPNKMKLIPRLYMMFFQSDYQVVGVRVDGRIEQRDVMSTDIFKSHEHSAGVTA